MSHETPSPRLLKSTLYVFDFFTSVGFRRSSSAASSLRGSRCKRSSERRGFCGSAYFMNVSTVFTTWSASPFHAPPPPFTFSFTDATGLGHQLT
jgi:hypothetical protein